MEDRTELPKSRAHHVSDWSIPGHFDALAHHATDRDAAGTSPSTTHAKIAKTNPANSPPPTGVKRNRSGQPLGRTATTATRKSLSPESARRTTDYRIPVPSLHDDPGPGNFGASHLVCPAGSTATTAVRRKSPLGQTGARALDQPPVQPPGPSQRGLSDATVRRPTRILLPLAPLIDVRRKRSRKPAKPPRQSHVFARPLRLFNPPLTINRGTGEQENDRPPALLPITEDSIVRSWGPERIETGWWRGLTVCRDYWRVETETGQQFWIFQDLRNKNWFLHGQF